MKSFRFGQNLKQTTNDKINIIKIKSKYLYTHHTSNPAFCHAGVIVSSRRLVQLHATVADDKHSAIWQCDITGAERVEFDKLRLKII